MCALAYNMASRANVDAFHKDIQYALKKLGKPNLPLKEQRYEILKAVMMVAVVIGKSLIYQSIGFIFDFLRSDSDSQHAATVVSFVSYRCVRVLVLTKRHVGSGNEIDKKIKWPFRVTLLYFCIFFAFSFFPFLFFFCCSDWPSNGLACS